MVDNKIIIWATDDFNALGLLRQLVPAGLDVVFLVKGKPKYASKSVYNRNMVVTSNIDEGYDYLMSHFREEKNKPIIITSSDMIMVFIDRHRHDMKDFFILPGTTQQGLQEKYTDKNVMTELAQEMGILCPMSRYIKKGDDISGWLYPSIIKPSHQKPGHYNEFKFKICKNEKQLINTLKYVREDSEFILQQYIKKEKDILVYGARMSDGETRIAGVFVRSRLADSGSSSYGKIYSVSETPECYKNSIDLEKIGCFLNKIDYKGPFSFEYGYFQAKSYFFEVNLRNDGTSHYFYQLGANIPLAYVMSCVGEDYSQVQYQVTKTGTFIDEVFDVENVINGSVKWQIWKKEKKEANVYKYYSKDDLAPWEYVKKYKWRQIIQDLILAKYRLYVVFLIDKIKIWKSKLF